MPDSTTSTKVLFKRGLQASVPGDGVIQDGVFYLTTDTGRLYVGQKDNSTSSTRRVLLNQTVQFTTQNGLTQMMSNTAVPWVAADHLGDFVYLSDINVLAAYDGTEWVQVNPDTFQNIQQSNFSATATNNIATVDSVLTLERIRPDGTPVTGVNSTTVTSGFSIQGTGGIDVSTSGSNTIVLEGNTYHLANSTAVAGIINLTLSSDNSTATDVISLKAGSSNNVTLSTTGSNNDQIVIDASDTKITGVTLTNPQDGQLHLVINSEGSTGTLSNSATLSNLGVIVGSDNGSYLPIGSTTGKSTATVYTKAEIDQKFSGLDGMTYMGTVAPAPTAATVNALPDGTTSTAAVHCGDVYVVTANSNDQTYSLNQLGTTASAVIGNPGDIRVGDMFIATSTGDPKESDGVISSANLKWSYIPSGNDSSLQYEYAAYVDTAAANPSISLKDGTQIHNEIMAIALSAGNDISISATSTSATNITYEIAHETITSTSSTTTASSTTTFTAVSGLTIDNGHVTGYTLESFTPDEYHFGSYTSVTSNAAIVLSPVTVNTTANNADVYTYLKKGDSLEAFEIAKTTFKSSSIELSSTTAGEVVMDIVWGTF